MKTPADQQPMRNGQEMPPRRSPAYSQSDSDLPQFVHEAPSAAELDAARARTAETIAGQDATELRNWKSFDEIDAERQVAKDHRAELLRMQKKHNAAEIRRQEKELDLDEDLTDQARRDQRDARRAKDQLNRLSSPVSYLASQVRAKRAALALAAVPSVVGVVVGAVNVGDSITRLVGDVSVLLSGLAYGVEPLVTLPLISILLYQAADTAQAESSWSEFRKARFFGIKTTLLAGSMVANGLPHMLLGEPATAALWMAVPVMIVVSLVLMPNLASAFNDRIAAAKTEAELSTPAGSLTGEQTKLLRHVRAVEEAEVSGQLGGQRDSDGMPSSKATRKALVATYGKAGVPDSMATVSALRLLRGVDE